MSRETVSCYDAGSVSTGCVASAEDDEDGGRRRFVKMWYLVSCAVSVLSPSTNSSLLSR